MLFKTPHPERDRLYYERIFWDQGLDLVAGVDEVGRGCLAGPVVACAVILPKGLVIDGVRDSKALSPKKREQLFYELKDRAVAWSIKVVSPEEIDRINILQASLRAMSLAVEGLTPRPQAVLVDGNQPFQGFYLQKTIPKGDALSQSIAAASILAKVYRDRIMEGLHLQYPHYAFSRNKGYPTKEHREAIKRYGATPVHRKTFHGVS